MPFSRAAEAKDKVAFLSFVDPDARFISSRVTRGRAEIGDAWSAVLTEGGPTMRWRPAFVEVAADGKIAISRGPYRSTRIDENGETHYSWGHFISKTNVAERPAHHHKVVPPARTVRVELPARNVGAQQELTRWRGRRDPSRRVDVVGGDGIAQFHEHASTLNDPSGFRLQREVVEIGWSLDIC